MTKHYKTTEYISKETIDNIIKEDNAHLLDIYFTNGFGGTFHKIYTSDSVNELKEMEKGWFNFANESIKCFSKICKRYHTFSVTYYYKSGKKYIKTFY